MTPSACERSVTTTTRPPSAVRRTSARSRRSCARSRRSSSPAPPSTWTAAATPHCSRDPQGRPRRNSGIETRRIPMKKLLWAAALAALAAFPATATADGIAFAGTENARTGVTSPETGSHYATLSLPKRTVVTKIGPEGAILYYSSLRGQWGIPVVAFDGTKAGLSGDGRLLVLAQPPIGQMRKVSRFPVLSTKNLHPIHTIVLRGSFSFDALSPDGRTLYLIEHVNRNDVAEYQVRAYDLNERRLLPYVIRDHREEEVEMYGYPMSRVTSPDGRWAYTLYQGNHHSFVHALDTEARDAFCIDLPMDTPPEYVADSRLVLHPDAATLTVNSRSAGVLGLIDTKALEFRPPAEESPTAPLPGTDEGLPWAA